MILSVYFINNHKLSDVMRLLALLLPFTLSVACEKLEFTVLESGGLPEESLFIDRADYTEPPEDVLSNDVLLRAYQMATIEWTPVNRIPYRNGIYYEPGTPVQGIPYSSVKEINTYLFQDVSYHTFMTAVHNPRSVMYTEDISKPPYHGLNCAPYYGAVCSSSVMYALGFSIPYYVKQIKDLPYIHKLETQSIDSLKVCDVILKAGHVQMIFNTEYQADTLYRITTFESSGMSAHIETYSKSKFKKMWVSEGYVGYRYENINYSQEPVVFSALAPIEYNDDLCPSKGDRAVYRTDDEIVIDIFNERYDTIVLVKEDRIIREESITGDRHSYSNLDSGIYSVYLQKGSEKSEPVSFEAVETDVSYSLVEDRQIVIRFNSSAKADYAALCTVTGESIYYSISDLERELGYIKLPRMTRNEFCFCKVVFEGKYGRIINTPIRIIR